MQIQLSIETTQPLTGTASAGDRQTAAFVGWLDLLRAISDLVNADAPRVVGDSDAVKPRPAGGASAGRRPCPDN